MKLGKRLKQLESMVDDGYTHIWDCCCDHGLLGAALLARKAAPYIHFVDITPGITAELEQKLARFYPRAQRQDADSHWQIHCQDLTTLPLINYTGKHLLIIAGVGGELMADFVRALWLKNVSIDMDFLLCPVNDAFHLRQQLLECKFHLCDEILVSENKRFYEIMLVTNRDGFTAEINTTGRRIWQSTNAAESQIAVDYLHKTLAHYQRIQSGGKLDVQHIINAYNAVTISTNRKDE